MEIQTVTYDPEKQREEQFKLDCDVKSALFQFAVDNLLNKPKILIRYHYELYPDLLPVEKKGNYIDLRAAERVELKAGEHKIISLGVSMQLPEGYYAQLVPRSSAFKNWKILETNSPAIIDTAYCGDDDIWKMSVYATADTIIEMNERVCQFAIFKDNDFDLETVDKLNGTNRGGFGSTGKN